MGSVPSGSCWRKHRWRDRRCSCENAGGSVLGSLRPSLGVCAEPCGLGQVAGKAGTRHLRSGAATSQIWFGGPFSLWLQESTGNLCPLEAGDGAGKSRAGGASRLSSGSGGTTLGLRRPELVTQPEHQFPPWSRRSMSSLSGLPRQE